MESRIRELERQLGRETLEVEILKEALDRSRLKKRPCSCARNRRKVSGEPGGEHARRSTLGVARSTVYERLTGSITTRGRYTKADDGQLLPLIQHIAAKRPTDGSRRIAAVLNRQLRAEGADPVNHMA
jgi:hypothetical protein